MDTCQVYYCWATTGTPKSTYFLWTLITFSMRVWTHAPVTFNGNVPIMEWVPSFLQGKRPHREGRGHSCEFLSSPCCLRLLVFGKPSALMLSLNLKCVKTWQWESPSVGFQGCEWVMKVVRSIRCVLWSKEHSTSLPSQCPQPPTLPFVLSPCPASSRVLPRVESLMKTCVLRMCFDWQVVPSGPLFHWAE